MQPRPRAVVQGTSSSRDPGPRAGGSPTPRPSSPHASLPSQRSCWPAGGLTYSWGPPVTLVAHSGALALRAGRDLAVLIGAGRAHRRRPGLGLPPRCGAPTPYHELCEAETPREVVMR